MAQLSAPQPYQRAHGPNNVSDANNDLDIAVGETADDGVAYRMRLTSALTKQAGAAWVAGTHQGGMLNSETKPASGACVLHAWLIVSSPARPAATAVAPRA